MPFYQTYYHLIWATYKREPFLVDRIEKQIYGTILSKAKELGCPVHAIGGIDDHIHIAISIAPKLAVADVIRQLKGSSTYYVNHQPDAGATFGWQRGYGVLTFGGRSMPTVVAYVQNQKEHHRQQSTIALYERIDED